MDVIFEHIYLAIFGIVVFLILSVLLYAFIDYKTNDKSPKQHKPKKITVRNSFFIFLFFLISLLMVASLYLAYKAGLLVDTKLFYMALAITTVTVCFSISYSDKKSIKYAICPNCGKSTLMIDKWQCYWCNSVQPTPTSFLVKCCECERKQPTAVCEHCRKEFRF